MKITYRKKTGEVVMEGVAIDNDSLASKTIPKSAKKKGYKMFYKKGKLKYEDTPDLSKQKKADEMDRLLGEIESAKNLNELKPLLVKIFEYAKL